MITLTKNIMTLCSSSRSLKNLNRGSGAIMMAGGSVIPAGA